MIKKQRTIHKKKTNVSFRRRKDNMYNYCTKFLKDKLLG